jgi:hypothetical protein
MNKGFVCVRSGLSSDEVKKLLEKLATEKTYYFVRSTHAVSGICMKLPPEFPGFEGQMFDADRELRWKKQGSQYELLLLSRVEADLQLGFDAIDKNSEWQICDRPAYFYNTGETRFPKGFTFKDEKDHNIEPAKIPVAQRYFQNAKTAIVHFIALTISK